MLHKTVRLYLHPGARGAHQHRLVERAPFRQSEAGVRAGEGVRGGEAARDVRGGAAVDEVERHVLAAHPRPIRGQTQRAVPKRELFARVRSCAPPHAQT